MRNLYLSICLLMAVFLKGQSNLVPNPSFETYTACPNGSSQVYLAVPWTGPTCNSTDYVNACNNTASYYGVPSIVPGYYQWPRTGNGYAVFWAGFNGPNYREYLQTPLTNTLIAGKCYYVEFFTNLANYVDIGVNNIAAHLSNQAFTTSLSNSSQFTLLSLSIHALKFGNPIITDTLNWVKISGVYKANGGENYIIIGNFNDDLHTDSIGIQSGPNRAGYYYIDDVSVIPTDSMSLPPYAGNDTTIAAGDSAFIGRQLYGLNCNWYNNNILIDTNISGIWVKPTVTTTYVVEQNLCGNVGYDTVTISVVGYADIKKHTRVATFGAAVYPNPNVGKDVAINTLNLANGTVAIKFTDVEGRVVFENSYTVENGSTTFKLTDIKNGIYFVHITNLSTGEKVVKKLVIQY